MPTLPTTPERELVHKPVIEVMKRMGYGLLTDGETFYQLGMELEPRSGITFSMKEAYAISTELRNQATELLGEVEKMIGDNEDVGEWLDSDDFNGFGADGRNSLRAEQRKQLASLRSKYATKQQ